MTKQSHFRKSRDLYIHVKYSQGGWPRCKSRPICYFLQYLNISCSLASHEGQGHYAHLLCSAMQKNMTSLRSCCLAWLMLIVRFFSKILQRLECVQLAWFMPLRFSTQWKNFTPTEKVREPVDQIYSLVLSRDINSNLVINEKQKFSFKTTGFLK